LDAGLAVADGAAVIAPDTDGVAVCAGDKVSEAVAVAVRVDESVSLEVTLKSGVWVKVGPLLGVSVGAGVSVLKNGFGVGLKNPLLGSLGLSRPLGAFSQNGNGLNACPEADKPRQKIARMK
jgi:hypothetical protein